MSCDEHVHSPDPAYFADHEHVASAGMRMIDLNPGEGEPKAELLSCHHGRRRGGTEEGCR